MSSNRQIRFAVSYKRDVGSKDDFDLAMLELGALTDGRAVVCTAIEAANHLGLRVLPLVEGHQAFCIGEGTVDVLASLVRRLAFWDYVFCGADDIPKPDCVSVDAAFLELGEVIAFATQSQILEWSAYARESRGFNSALTGGGSIEDLKALASPTIDMAIKSSLTPASRRRNDYLTHGFHKYKAKFFPRLARSLINFTCPQSAGVVLDPYCGSGTTGVEAMLLGLECLQFDIDPLSVEIANAKAQYKDVDVEAFHRVVLGLPKSLPNESLFTHMPVHQYRIPAFLLERKPRHLTEAIRVEVEAEATAIRTLLDELQDASVRALLRLCLSHALATKISLRWMGTGDNRYALEVASRGLYQIFRTQAAYMMTKLGCVSALKQGCYLQHDGEATASVADCADIPLASESVDCVVTSPPYLPAASGRETYLRSRATSLVGLDLLTEEEIHERETRIVGSIMAEPGGSIPLPAAVEDLVRWMTPQRERASKAQPTAAYFERLGASLAEMKRVLKPGGMIALVVSKEHMFYAMKSREVLRRFSMVDSISELATHPKFGIELVLQGVQELELPKMDFAARPGSRGTYSEAILFFRKG